MISRLLASAALFGVCLSTPALIGQTAVWKVTRGAATLYLGGTIHVLRAEDFPLPPEFDQAFAASTRIVFETDVARMQSPEMHTVIAKRGMFTDGTTLEKVLTPEAWKAVQTYCAQAGLPVGQISQLRPWLFTLMMAAVELQKLGISTAGVDLHYFKQASAHGKKTDELETFERHIEFITQLGAGHESEMILKSLDDLHEVPAVMTKLLAAWRAGDVSQLDKLMLREMRTKYPSIFKELLVKRNDAWLPKIDGFLKTAEVEFVLVGAGHLPGKEGLLAKLRAQGCRIEQIKAPGKSRTRG